MNVVLHNKFFLKDETSRLIETFNDLPVFIKMKSKSFHTKALLKCVVFVSYIMLFNLFFISLTVQTLHKTSNPLYFAVSTRTFRYILLR